VHIVLTASELAELDRQNPATKDDGGYQDFLVTLQQRVNRTARELALDDRDLERIPRYAFDYKRGGWQKRLKSIFSRSSARCWVARSSTRSRRYREPATEHRGRSRPHTGATAT
jgi:hypothetical protein